MKSCEYCSNDDCKLVGGTWYCLECPECEVKESKMEFDKSRVYTALNADELQSGDEVIIADNLYSLKQRVQNSQETDRIAQIMPEDFERRFTVGAGNFAGVYAYLISKKENCNNCGVRWKCLRQVRPNPELIKCCNYEPEVKKENCTTCMRYGKDCMRGNGNTSVAEDMETCCPNYRTMTDDKRKADFISRAEAFKKDVEEAETKHKVNITVGYIRTCDDDQGIIEDADGSDYRVYYKTLSDKERVEM